MRATHWAINYSAACQEGGDGICDGEVPAGEGNPNAVTDECTCKCHTTDDLPPTIQGVKDWHDAWYAPEILDPVEAAKADARRIVRQGLAQFVR